MISHKQAPPELWTARDYLKRLTTLLETDVANDLPQVAIISQLRVDLLAAVEDYDLFCQHKVTFEDCFMKQSHLLWLCNQCEYYLAKPSVAKISRQPNQGLWQIQAAVLASMRFKLYAHVRRFFLRKKSISLPWRDLLAGLKLWNLR